MYRLYRCATQNLTQHFSQFSNTSSSKMFCTVCITVPYKIQLIFFWNCKYFQFKIVSYCLYHCTVFNNVLGKGKLITGSTFQAYLAWYHLFLIKKDSNIPGGAKYCLMSSGGRFWPKIRPNWAKLEQTLFLKTSN